MQAARLRSESGRLRSRADRVSRENHVRYQDCVVALVRMRRLRDTGFRSAWSDLRWRWPDDTLDHLLIPIDGGRQ